MSFTFEREGLSANMVVLAQSRVSDYDVASPASDDGLFLDDFDHSGFNPLRLPNCVPADEVAAMTVCLHAVSAGEHTGLEFAELLQRAEMRCEAAFAVDGLNLSIEKARHLYKRAAHGIDIKCDLKTDFVNSVAGLAVVIGVTSRNSGLGRVDELDSSVRAALKLKVVGDNVVVATPAVGIQPDVTMQLHDDYKVVPLCVYSALVRIQARVMGSSVCVSLSRSVDGIYRVENEFDCSNCYAVSALPIGRYALPGGFGRLVSNQFLQGVLESVIALPALRTTPGYCYLGLLPPSMRLRASAMLGREPSIMNLTNYFPEVYDWTFVEAQVERTGQCGDNAIYHVVTGGTLPIKLSSTARIGMQSNNYESDLSKHTDRILNQIFSDAALAGANDDMAPGSSSKQRSASLTQAFPVVNKVPGQTNLAPVEHYDSIRGRQMGLDQTLTSQRSSNNLRVVTAPTRHTRAASDSGLVMSNRVVLDMNKPASYIADWTDIDNPKNRTWIQRLGEGAPIDTKVLMDLTKVKVPADLPSPPAGCEGVSLIMKPNRSLRAEDGRLVAWERRSTIIPGCNLEYAKLSSVKGRRFLVVPPAENILCRYDFHFEKSVVVNGTVAVQPRGTVLWLHGSASIYMMGKGSIVRTWFDDGMPGLGPFVTSMVFTFDAIAIKNYVAGINAERVIGLDLKSFDRRAGLVRFHKRFKMRPNNEKVHLYAFDDVVTEPALLVVQAIGMRHLTIHNVKVPSSNGSVSAVVMDTQTTVGISVDARGQSTVVDVEMIFVKESQRYAALSGHDITPDNRNFPGKRTLYIQDG